MGSEELGQLFYGLKNEENTNMTEKRVLIGYSKEVQADFKRFKKDCCYPLLATISGLESFGSLRNLIVSAEGNEDKQLFQDIADFINDKAEFEEEKHIYRLANASLRSFGLYLTTNYDMQLSTDVSKACKLSKGELKFILTGTKFNQDQFIISD